MSFGTICKIKTEYEIVALNELHISGREGWREKNACMMTYYNAVF